MIGGSDEEERLGLEMGCSTQSENFAAPSFLFDIGTPEADLLQV